ncbi:unnamed protein product [Blepharisma stoltei]|uniref:Peptidase M14 domain-containing protein n=1 Tax=Blepharisma stoltei TaxID=1481888 RepID=A0AAU9K132_9CILI|nr:unnamed protein product [Blepharisma stoltei]
MKFSAVIFVSLIYFILASWQQSLNNGTLGGFFTLEEINNDLNRISSQFSNIATFGSVGKSALGIDINYVQLIGDGLPTADKGGVLITSSLYAGYPANPSFVMYLLKDFANLYSEDSYERSILLTTNIWFVPVVNVDAYNIMQESYKGSSFQVIKKNSKDTGCANSAGDGVNLDRNWDFKWGHSDEGSSSDPCDEEYRGTAAFSEVESKILRDFLIGKNITTWLHYEGEGDLYILPYTSMNITEITTPDPMFKGVYANLTAQMQKLNIIYGLSKQINGKYEDGTVIDYALSRGIFSFQGQVGSDSKNITGDIISYFKPHFEIALWNIFGASFYIEAHFYDELYKCRDWPGYCLHNESAVFFYGEMVMNNYGFTAAKHMLLNVTFDYEESYGYRFSLQNTSSYIITSIVTGKNVTDYVPILFDEIYSEKRLIWGVVSLDIPAMSAMYFGFVLESPMQKKEHHFRVDWNVTLDNIYLPKSESIVIETSDHVQMSYADNGGGSSGLSQGAIAGLVIGLLVAILIIIGLVWYLCRRRRFEESLIKQAYQHAPKDSKQLKGFSSGDLQFNTEDYATPRV